MGLPRNSRLFMPAFIGAAVSSAAAIGTANAELELSQSHDGVYVIDITTKQGSCDKDYRWTISVSGGHIKSAGYALLEASGQINQRGVVNVAFARFGQVATARGRLASDGGSGTWYSPTLQCGGFWHANRQG